ncbi:3-dehydroquinate synthase [[Clostridium] innocuum]|nr:3-dehydroquinate synthase [[Clostridium] innocuum]
MKLHVDLKENGYDIIMEHGILYRLNDHIDLNRKVMIVTDSGVPEAYANIVREQCKKGYIHVIEQGEDSKDLSIFKEINENLLAHKFSRKDCVIALGGGVVGDLAGYVAASYMRGIDFIQIPTTTLSQIDSSIGGKVAINLDEVKNIVGAFYQPKIVFIDPETLQTLPKRHYINGLIEALKAGLIYDASLFELFEQGDINKDLDTIIVKALRVKKDVVEQDEREQGLRKILNFGHTIGHAIESYYHLSEYLHGECVALGMLYFIDNEQLKQRVLHVYKHLGIRTQVDFDPEAVYQLLCRDKKADGDYVTIVRVRELGAAELVETPLSEVHDILKGTAV